MGRTTATMQFLRKGTEAALYGIRDKVDRSFNEDVVRLAVTGLSRAGKTVFITSLIQNLLALGDGYDSLPALSQALGKSTGSRLREMRIIPPSDGITPWFDYPSKVAKLASDRPDWPRPTDDLAEISLSVHVERRSMFGQVLGERRVRLDILDYPGEWLLDLPLLGQTYQDWSRQTLQLMGVEPRLSSFAAFRAYVSTSFQPNHSVQDALIQRAHILYKEALKACQTQHGLRYLQPGRFLCPGPEGAEMPFLWFFPMEVPDGAPLPGSVAELLVGRFERYKQHIRDRFVVPHLRRFNRQVLLVDVLTPLYAGQAAFEDTARAIGEVTSSLAHQKIGRVCVAATKADHVPELTRANLRELVRVLARAASRPRATDAITFRTVASINSTEEGQGKIGDNDVAVVKGMVEGKLRPFFVGQVPSIWPPTSFWERRFFQLPNFQPRPYDPATGVIPHLGLDLVLSDLIGDLL